MSFQEKRNLVSLLSNLLISIIYFVYVIQNYVSGSLTDITDFRFWGAVILILIPVQIVGKIILHIIFTIINKIITNEDEPSFSDELDKLIELKAARNSLILFMIGFVISMASLVIGMPIALMFIILILSLISSEVIWDVSHLYLYRKGF
ncbi:MAG: hypothetical protein KJ571_02240 [Bacteroidetes bacterium]|nr:hypothetical protein [Bacteroidota bacterium]